MNKIAKTLHHFDQFAPKLLSLATDPLSALQNPKFVAIANILSNLPYIFNQPLNTTSVPGTDPNISPTILANGKAIKTIQQIAQSMALAQSTNPLNPNIPAFAQATQQVLSNLNTIINNLNQNNTNTNLLSDKSYNIQNIIANLTQVQNSIQDSYKVLASKSQFSSVPAELQQQLNRFLQNTPGFTQLQIDQSFGPATQQAVISAKEKLNLPQETTIQQLLQALKSQQPFANA